jgi:dTDP-4-dehydrorhamnose reductase
MGKIALFGSGQVAQHIAAELTEREIDFDIVGRADAPTVEQFRPTDVKIPVDAMKVHDIVSTLEPYEKIIYTSAYRDIKACEADFPLALHINSTIPNALSLHKPLMYISTDYVFGQLDEKHEREVKGKISEDEIPTSLAFSGGPKSAYGKSKLNGEVMTLRNNGIVVRIASPFGKWKSPLRHSFVDMISGAQNALNLPEDQIITPTYLPEGAKRIVDVAENLGGSAWGTYHVVSHGEVSYYELGRHIRRIIKSRAKTLPRKSTEEGDELRPTYSALANNRVEQMPFWADSVAKHYGRG